MAQGTVGIDIAKFNVSVNDINVKDGTPIQFNFSETSTFVKGKVAPNSKGYFEFIINPSETEVSLEYEFMFNLDGLNENFKLTHFTINDDETYYDITDGNTIRNDLLLPSNEYGFTDADKKTIRVYWSWDEEGDIINPDINDYEGKNISVIVIVKQKID